MIKIFQAKKNQSLFGLVFLLFFIFNSCKKQSENTKLTGPVFGTSYSIIYDSEVNFTRQIDSLFEAVNQSMSTYIPNSDISRLNRNEPVTIDGYFKTVFLKSKEIHKSTKGIFDPTIGDVVNAWKFGAEDNKFLTDSTTIDSLMRFVGLEKVTLNGNTINKPSQTYIEFNAIAKGYGVDVIAEFLESKAVQNYLVEIGGEIRAKGLNIQKKQPWRVGLDEPRFDGEQSIYKAITLRDEAMATSGTYRKFKTDSLGNRYAHIIDTKTGYPSKTNILSVSVIAKDCMTADGYATAFQAMGNNKIEQFLESHPELKVFIIFENDQNEFESLSLNGFPEV